MSIIASANVGSAATYQIDHSVRLAAARSCYFSRTFGTPTDNKKWTIKFHVKRGTLSNVTLLSAGSGAGNEASIFISNADQLEFYYWTGSYVFRVYTTAVFRDPTAHYDFEVVADFAQAQTAHSAADSRIRIYRNGVQQTTAGTMVSQNYASCPINANGVAHRIGQRVDGTTGLDGYLSDIYFIDGQALTPSDFGEFSSVNPSLWIPKAYTGTYGNNGFHLDFNDGTSATTLGYDVSGNGNHWAASGISTTAGVDYDWMEDTPTKNYCVLSGIDSGKTLSNANLSYAGSTNGVVKGAIAVSSGKWYWEYLAQGAQCFTGLAQTSVSPSATWLGALSNGWGYYGGNGNKYNNNTDVAYGASFTTNDIIGVAFDADNGTLEFFKNNTSQGVAYNTGLTGSVYCPAAGNNVTNDVGSFNFGQRPFAYTPPTGFLALNTANLPAVPTALLNPSDHHTDITVTKSGDTAFTIPWSDTYDTFFEIKSRGATGDWYQIDTLRGVDKILKSNSTAAETTDANVLSVSGTTGTLLSTLADGTYVISMTKAGLVANRATHTDGTITSTVSANTDSGFSIVTATSQPSGSGTIGHGLGTVPKLIIARAKAVVTNWAVYSGNLANTEYLELNTTIAKATSAGYWNSTTPTTSVFSLGTSWAGSLAMVFYCYADSAIQKSFSYTGNGSADGPFVWLGFECGRSFVKQTTTASATNWNLLDSARDTTNVASRYLEINTSALEGSSAILDFTALGMKFRTTAGGSNASGGTYIGHAWAKEIFGGENTSPATAR